MNINAGAQWPLQDFAVLIARLLMSAIFIWSGYGKLMAAAGTKAYFSSLGLPSAELVWLVAVVVELGGGIAILLGIYARIMALALSAWCIATALVAHAQFGDLNMAIHFMKNLAMAGGLILLYAFGPGAYALDGVATRGRAGPQSTGW